MCMCSSEAVEMMCKKRVTVYLNPPYAYVGSKQNQDIVRKIGLKLMPITVHCLKMIACSL